MSLRRTVFSLLDRPGGRAALARLATLHARRGAPSAGDFEVFYDGVWGVRSGDVCVPLADVQTYVDRADWGAALADRMRASADYWFYRYDPAPGDVVVDVGAGDGADAITFSRAVGGAGRVVSVEAHPGTYRRLAALCRWNRLANVTPLHLAISDRRGRVFIEDGADDETNAIRASAGAGTIAEPVDALSLDELYDAQRLDRVDYLKMNIEGAERLAIRAASRAIARTRCVTIACHDFLSTPENDASTLAEVTDFLRASGFETSTRPDDAREYVRYHVHGVRPR